MADVWSVGGVPQLVHPGRGVPQLVHLGGGGGTQLIHPEGGSTSVFTSRGSTSVFTSGGSTSMFISGGSHVSYPIMLLYTTIECPSASWAKFTWEFCDHFQGPLLWPLLGGVPCDLSHNALDVTSLLSRHQLMGLAWCSCLYTTAPMHHRIRSHGTPPQSWTD